MTPLRIGQGYDVHVFEAGDHVTLGGVRIPHSQGIRAHSDGDVLLHALCDALLGAAALGDIGMHFPDTDARWRGADSRVFLRHVRDLLVQRSFAVVNVDATVLAEAPRLGKHRETMCANIAADLGISLVTVQIHRGKVMRKMRARSVPDLVRMADTLGVSASSPATA